MQAQKIIYVSFLTRLIAMLLDLVIIGPIIFLVITISFSIYTVGYERYMTYIELEAEQQEEHKKKEKPHKNELKTQKKLEVQVVKEEKKSEKEILEERNKLFLDKKDINFNLLFAISIIGFSIIYPFWKKCRSTPGKLLLSIGVVDEKTLGRLTFCQSILRFIGYLLNVATLGAGFLFILFNDKKKSLPDYLAKSIVIKVK